MKTKKQVLADNPEFRTLINAVINRIGLDSVEDVVNHGIDGGFNGFIYYEDTHNFAIRHRKQIIALCRYMVDAVGYRDIHDMVMSFRCVNSGPDSYTDNYLDLCGYLGGSKLEQCQITNAMAWFAAEEVCRMFEE